MSQEPTTASAPGQPVATGARGASKYLVAASVMLGTFLSVMDATVVNVALPHMMGTFGQDMLTITWVSTAYSIAEIIMITMAAWWTALLGRKRLFIASMVLFIVGSVMAGTSTSLGQMIFYRILQGIGGGSLIPCSQAIARETFPVEEQGMAMAIYAMGVVLAPALGPVFGGWLVDNYGWQWVFYINVPFCAVGIMMVSAFVRDPPYLKRGLQHIDWGGIALLTLGLAATQIVLERGERVDWFASGWIVTGAITAVIAIVTLIIWEMKSGEPIINFRLLRNVPLSVGSGLGAAIGFALYGSSFLLPQLTQNLMGYPAYQAGLVLMPRALAMLVAMPIVGRLYNYVSPRILVSFGIGALAFGYWRLSHFSLAVGFWTFTPVLIITGIGMGCSFVTLSTLSLSTVPRASMTGASGLYTLSRREAGNVAYAVLATMVARRVQFHRAMFIGNLSVLNQTFRQAGGGLAARLLRFGIGRRAIGVRGLAMMSGTVNRQVTMMAYNDAFYILVPLFILLLPLMLLLPSKSLVARMESAES